MILKHLYKQNYNSFSQIKFVCLFVCFVLTVTLNKKGVQDRV